MSKTPKSTFSLQNFHFRFKFFFDQNLDFVLGRRAMKKGSSNSQHMRGSILGHLGLPGQAIGGFFNKFNRASSAESLDAKKGLKKNLASKNFGHLH